MNRQQVELINLFHLALTALDAPSRGERLAWAANAYSKDHPDVSKVSAYKALDRALA